MIRFVAGLLKFDLADLAYKSEPRAHLYLCGGEFLIGKDWRVNEEIRAKEVEAHQ